MVLTGDRLLCVRLEDMAVCSLVKAELFSGALRSNNPTRTLEHQQEVLGRFASLPFGDEAAIVCGQIRARLASAGTPIGAYDSQIAAAMLVDNTSALKLTQTGKGVIWVFSLPC